LHDYIGKIELGSGGLPWLSRVEVRTSERGGAKSYLRLIKTALELRSKRPIVLLAPLLVDRLRNALWIRLIGARISVGETGKWTKIGFDRSVMRQPGVHKVERFIQFGVKAGFPDLIEPDVRIPVSADEKAEARSKMPGWNPQQRWVVMAPGSGKVEAHKRWPTICFQKLTGLLLKQSSQIRIAILGSKEERDLLESVIRGADFDTGRCHIFSEEDVVSALALLTQCHCIVCGCSGAAHMAAAAGIPIVGLFGPTNPKETGPYSKQLCVVNLGMECSPCYGKDFNTGCGDPICMSMIEPQKVFKEVYEILENVSCDLYED
jgi:ADP-heptose:LPS heptosyltransferase